MTFDMQVLRSSIPAHLMRTRWSQGIVNMEKNSNSKANGRVNANPPFRPLPHACSQTYRWAML